jgi:putative membrane protein
MKSPLTQLLLRWLVLAVGVMLATKLVHGISCEDGLTLFCVVLLLSFFNAIIRPLLVLFTLPFIIVTMGLGVLVINALLFLLVGRLVDGFTVAGFWPAVGGSLVVSVTIWLASAYIRTARKDNGRTPPPPKPPRGGDVIDI